MLKFFSAKQLLYGIPIRNLLLLTLFLCSHLQPSKAFGTEEFNASTSGLSSPPLQKYHTYEELMSKFQKVLHIDLVDDFNKGWGAIYKAYEEGEITRLSSTKENSHIECLYKTLSHLKNQQERDWRDSQKLNVYSVLFASPCHARAISKHCSEVARSIKLFLNDSPQ